MSDIIFHSFIHDRCGNLLSPSGKVVEIIVNYSVIPKSWQRLLFLIFSKTSPAHIVQLGGKIIRLYDLQNVFVGTFK